MNKKEQQKLIEKIIQSPKPNQDTNEFKKLQMHWYNKLEDKTDYEDIERTGTMRHKYYDEYGGLIKRYSWSITDKYDFSAHQYYQTLRKISWDAIVTSNSKCFDQFKPSKSYKLEDFEALKPKSDSNDSPSSSLDFNNSTSPVSPDSPQTIKIQKLSKVDSKILYLAGDGQGVREISKYLRRYLPHHARRGKRGPKGKPFSVFYVHNRLTKLVESIQAGHIFEGTEAIRKDLNKIEKLTLYSPAPKTQKHGEVRKTGLSLNSYINTENNND